MDSGHFHKPFAKLVRGAFFWGCERRRTGWYIYVYIYILLWRAHPSWCAEPAEAPLNSSAGSGCTVELSDHLVFYALKWTSRPPFVCTSVTTTPCLFHPHTSLIRLAASHHTHLLVSPSPLSNHPLCFNPRSQASFLFTYFFALLFFSACFSCCLVCRPCVIWFSLSGLHHSIRTATVGDKLSTSSLI